MTTSIILELRRLELELRRLQITPEERLQLSLGGKPFSLAEWRQAVPRANPEEVLEMEELLMERQRAREISLTRASVPVA